MQTKNFQRYFQFLLIVLAAGSIYPLIFLRSGYQETILQVFGLTPEQLNNIYSALGFAFMAGYFPSGWLADRFSTKKLLFISLLICGLAGLWFAQIPSHSIVIIIFIIWGTFSVFTFWAAHLRIVKLLTREGEEGRFFGILDGGRGVVEAGLATIAMYIFASVSNNAEMGTTMALQGVIYLYSFFMIGISVLVLLFVQDGSKSAEDGNTDKEKTSINEVLRIFISDLRKLMVNKYVWLMGFIICMSYAVYWTIFYVGGFLQTNISVDAIRVAQVMVVSLWMRPVGGVLGGFLADKFNKNIVLAIALAFASASLVALAIVPVVAPQFFFEAMIICFSLMIFIVRGIYWALLGDCKIPTPVLGLAIGFISFLAYLPDILTPISSTVLLNIFGETTGQNAFFIFSAVLGAVGIILTFIFDKALKCEKSQQERLS